MSEVGKRAIRSLLERFGYQIRRTSSESIDRPSPVNVALHTLLSFRDEIGIVQIGANDGRFNDPIYPFVCENLDRTRILLIEPQSTVLPYLKSNYANHPNAVTANNAIGPAGEITLYAIAPDAWADCKVTYADPEWPPYRAPTGITSTNREMVVQWARNYYKGRRPSESVVIALPVTSVGLVQVIGATGFTTPVDLIQVDAEGFDDQALYNSDLETYRPTLINFESKSLTSDSLARLAKYLEDLGYELFHTGPDTLAILRCGAS